MSEQLNSTPNLPEISSLNTSDLLNRLQELAKTLKGFEAFQETLSGEHFDVLRQQSLALIEGKLIPELSQDLKLPLFVSIIGGTNTGKSTLFNALAGIILSESKITAGATKHPLIYLHEDWRELMMDGVMFHSPALLESSGQLLLKTTQDDTFMTFHERAELHDIALIDCPDFDSIESENAAVAYRVINQADLCIFVTTPQKYKDAILVDALKSVLKQKKQTFVLFNLTDDEMLYRTMVEDLKEEMDDESLVFGSYLETEMSAEPERALTEKVNSLFDQFLNEHPREVIKKDLLKHQLRSVVERSQTIVGEYKDQTERKEELLFQMQSHLKATLRSYEQDFDLNFPEIGAALMQQITQIELQRIFKPKTHLEASPQWTTFFSHGFGLAGQKLRRLFVRSFEFNDPPKDWNVFWRKRDEQDLAHLKQRAQLLRASIEQALRINSQSSAVSQLLLERFFTAARLREFDVELERAFWKSVQTEISIGQEILDQSKELNQSEGGFLMKSAAWVANGVKLCVGIFVAWITLGFGFWDLFFLPLGFVGGAYGITWLLYTRLKHKEALFKSQRVRLSRQLFEDVQINPLIDCVQQMANREELNSLANLSTRLEEIVH